MAGPGHAAKQHSPFDAKIPVTARHDPSLLSREGTAPLDELCDRLLEELVADGAEDDVAVLGVRAHPEGARPPEAGPERVPPVVPALP